LLLARTDGIEGFERHVVLKRIPAGVREGSAVHPDVSWIEAARRRQTPITSTIRSSVRPSVKAAGEYFIAMEYIHGEDVSQRSCRMGVEERARRTCRLGYGPSRSCRPAAAGLQLCARSGAAATKRPLGIVHSAMSRRRNILVGLRRPSVKVVDFGNSRRPSMKQETRSGSLKGKVSYMSARASARATSIRIGGANVYSLGGRALTSSRRRRCCSRARQRLPSLMEIQNRPTAGGPLVVAPRSAAPDLPNEAIDRSSWRGRSRRNPEQPVLHGPTSSGSRLRTSFAAKEPGSRRRTSVRRIAAYLRKAVRREAPKPWLEIGDTLDKRLPDPVSTSRAAETAGRSWPPPARIILATSGGNQAGRAARISSPGRRAGFRKPFRAAGRTCRARRWPGCRATARRLPIPRWAGESQKPARAPHAPAWTAGRRRSPMGLRAAGG